MQSFSRPSRHVAAIDGSGIISVEKEPVPQPGPGEVLIDVYASLISPGTELWCLTDKFPGTEFPCIPGYQKVGAVERVGDAVSDYAVGDLVFLRFTRAAPGIHLLWAGHTELSVVAADEPEMFRLPAGVRPEEASLLSMSSVGYHGAAEVMPVAAGEHVVVIGLGLIGLKLTSLLMLALTGKLSSDWQ